MDVVMADSASACPICYSKFFSISYHLRVIQCFMFKGEFALWAENLGFCALYYPEVWFGINQNPQRHLLTPKNGFEPSYTFMHRSFRAVGEFEKVVNKTNNRPNNVTHPPSQDGVTYRMKVWMIGKADDVITWGQYDNDRTNGFSYTVGRSLELPFETGSRPTSCGVLMYIPCTGCDVMNVVKCSQ